MSLIKKFIFSGFSNSGLDFIMRVDTTITGTGTVTADNQFRVPVTEGVYNLRAVQGVTIVDFGLINGGGTAFEITLPATGVWDLRFTPSVISPLYRISFGNSGDRNKVTQIRQWGRVVWTSNFEFWGCQNLDVIAEDAPILGIGVNTANLFRVCNNLVNANGSISNWDTGNITTLNFSFRETTNFNQSLNNWNVSNVTNLAGCFSISSGYNQPLNNWDVSNVTTFSQMFFLTGASGFNQYVGGWNLRILGTNMNQIFRTSGMNTENYTDSIVGFANYVFENGAPFGVSMATQSGRTFQNSRSGGANFATAGDARTYLTTTAGWTISSDTIIP
jgi:hypothetical protein